MSVLSSPLFQSFTEKEYQELRQCRCIQEKNYSKGETIYFAGIKIQSLGLILRGRVNLENVNLLGARSILSTLTKGQIFGEAYALTKEALLVSAVAAEDCSILFVNVAHLYQGAHRDSTWYSKIMKNLLLISAYKNLHLSVRTSQTSFKKIRQRLEAYLSGISITQKSRQFDIPFNRQELADYLNVDRSALSKELMHMKKEGLIDYHKNHFVLYQ